MTRRRPRINRIITACKCIAIFWAACMIFGIVTFVSTFFVRAQ